MMASASEVTRFPIMDIQSNWNTILRSSSEKQFWVSCKEPDKKTENCYLRKGADGLAKGDQEGNFVVKDQNLCSVTVVHPKSSLVTTFLRPKRHLLLHNKQVLCADVSGSGELGVCSSGDGKLWVWEADTGTPRRELEGHVGDVHTCRFFPSGLVVLSGGADLRLKIWSAQDGSCARTLIGHKRGITDTAIIDRGRNFISVSADGRALLWDCGTAKCLDTVASAPCVINACAMESDSSLLNSVTPQVEPECGTKDKLVLLACEDGQLRCHSVGDRQNVMTYSSCPSPMNTCMFISPNLVLGGADDGTMTLVDIRHSSDAVGVWSFCSSPVKALVPIGENRYVAGFRDGSCVVWKGESSAMPETHQDSGLELMRLTGPEADPVTSISKSSGHIYTSCRDGSVREYSINAITKFGGRRSTDW